MEKILITGITGQDGIFLTNNLINLNSNIQIIGTTRSNDSQLFKNRLLKLNNKNNKNISLINIDLSNKTEVFEMVNNFKPTSVYNLAGPSSVYGSIDNPKSSTHAIESIFDNLIESLIQNKNFCNFFQASSSEMFENKSNPAIDESTNFNPNSPYAKAKLKNHNKAIELAELYDWNIVSGIMFNHESEFRNKNYLTGKIINSAIEIKKGHKSKLEIGSLEYIRVWSFAGDVVEAMTVLLNNDARGSFVIGSGTGNSIELMAQIVFNYFGLSLNDHVEINSSLLRQGDPVVKVSNPSKILNEFGWKSKTNFEDLLIRCIEKRENI